MRAHGVPDPDPGRNTAFKRLEERTLDRSRALHRMRGGIMLAISLIAGAGVFSFAMWALLLFTSHPAAPNVGILTFTISLVMDVVVLFLAWMTLEALGRIERETDRVQQFMDNVYRRLP